MADTTVSGTSNAAATTAPNSACQISKAAVDEMAKGDVSQGDAAASQKMDFAKLKDVLDKMKACNEENQARMNKLLDDANQQAMSKIRSIKN